MPGLEENVPLIFLLVRIRTQLVQAGQELMHACMRKDRAEESRPECSVWSTLSITISELPRKSSEVMALRHSSSSLGSCIGQAGLPVARIATKRQKALKKL